MVEIIKITPSTIGLKGIHFRESEKIQKIMDICHKYKHMYKEGYPYGRKTRKKNGQRLKKWAECPGICFTYLVTEAHDIEIHILVSNTERLLKKYTEQEINYYLQMFTQNIADEIIRTF